MFEIKWFIFEHKTKNNISDDAITVFVHNVRSLSKHINDTVSDDKIMNNDSILFLETEIDLSDSTCKIIETLNFFNINFNDNKSKFLHRKNIKIEI